MHKDRAQPFCSPQDHIHCGILFLTRQLRSLGQHEREQCLQEVWELARRRADLLTLQMIPGLPGVPQEKRTDLPTPPSLVLE